MRGHASKTRLEIGLFLCLPSLSKQKRGRLHKSLRIFFQNPSRRANAFMAITGFISTWLVLTLVWTASTSAAYPGANGKIAFTSNRWGSYSIYIMNADGTGQTRLIGGPLLPRNNPSDPFIMASNIDPVWSPDGSKIAFLSNRDLGGWSYKIYVANADGTGQTRLTELASSPTWSPDGSKIAFQSGNAGIYVINADGTGQTQLTSSQWDGGPKWSPDGSKIAFTRTQGDNKIYVMNADGTGQTQIPCNLWYCDSPAWSPDGSKIAFDGPSGPGFAGSATSPSIFVMNADGSGLMRLTDNSASNYAWYDSSPAWSPDGKKIVFVSTRYSGGIYIMNADGTGQTRLSDYSGNTNPSGDYILEDFPDWQPLVTNYFWTWYDNVGGDDWVLLANPSSATANLTYSLSIAGKPMDLSGYRYGMVAPGKSITPKYPGVIGGPVKAAAGGGAGLTSQRILWPKGGSSLEEVPGTDQGKLSNDFYWTWYDNQSPGYTNWVLVANPGTDHNGTPQGSVNATIKIAGSAVWSGPIAPGAKVTPTFPGTMGGPVEVTSSDGEVMASQRVLSNYGSAFNEVPGIPASSLSNDYIWTWYDNASAGFTDWVLIANPSGSPVSYQIKIGGQNVPGGSGTIPAYGRVTPTFPGQMNGPVEITASANVIASQRVIAGPSFEEVPGQPRSSLASDYNWTWYDNKSAGATNWILIANPNTTSVGYQIKIAGSQVASGTLSPGQRIIPTYPNTIAGPVEVTSTGGPVMASQRVTWNGYFNEVLGQ